MIDPRRDFGARGGSDQPDEPSSRIGDLLSRRRATNVGGLRDLSASGGGAGAAPLESFGSATIPTPNLGALLEAAAAQPTTEPSAPPAGTPSAPIRELPTGALADILRVRPEILTAGDVRLPRPPRLPEQPEPARQNATLLAQAGIRSLSDASVETVRAALEHIRAAQTPEGQPLTPSGLLFHLERTTRVGEVLNSLARDWSESTRADFGRALRVDPNRLDVMDAIVSIAILNHPLIDEEILGENIPQTTVEDMLDNRVIVDQWPPAGSQFQPPYVILVAVEYRQVAQGLDVVRQIMGQLADFDRFKLPRTVVQRLSGG